MIFYTRKKPLFYWPFRHVEKFSRAIVVDMAIVRFFYVKVDARMLDECGAERRIYASLSGVAVFSIVL